MANIRTAKILMAKCPNGGVSLRRSVLTAKSPYGEVFVRRIVLTANCPMGKCPTAKSPTAKSLGTLHLYHHHPTTTLHPYNHYAATAHYFLLCHTQEERPQLMNYQLIAPIIMWTAFFTLTWVKMHDVPKAAIHALNINGLS